MSGYPWTISFDATIYKLTIDRSADSLPNILSYFARATLQMQNIDENNFYLGNVLLDYSLCQSVTPTSIAQVMDFIVGLGA